MSYHPTSADIGPELKGAGYSQRRYRCMTCAGLTVTATSALQHIADGHTVVNRDGVRQSMSEHARQALIVQRQRTA